MIDKMPPIYPIKSNSVKIERSICRLLVPALKPIPCIEYNYVFSSPSYSRGKT